MSELWTPPSHSLVSSDTQLWGRQDRGQDEGLWEMGKESKHDSHLCNPSLQRLRWEGPKFHASLSDTVRS